MRMLLQKRAEWVCLGVGLLALAVRLALLPVRAIPQPTVQDEFAYLLGAETFCLGGVDDPAAPHVGTLRNLPRELPTHLCEQVSAGAVAVSGAGLEAVRASLVWRVAELRADVRGAVLDAARMAAAALRVAGRPDGGGAVGSRGVLDRFLLGRRGGRRGRGAGGGCRAASSAASHRRGGGAGGTGCGGPGQQPAL